MAFANAALPITLAGRDVARLRAIACGGSAVPIHGVCGLMMGDHSKCSINSMFNTGTVVGVVVVCPGTVLPARVETVVVGSEVMVKVKCEVHNWMNAWIGVLDHPFFAVSDDNGTFTITAVPSAVTASHAWPTDADASGVVGL